jgi:nitrite reductase/ring-hydroxylating ferredoxin subunit
MNQPILINVEDFLKAPQKRIMDLNPFGKKFFIIKNKSKGKDLLHLVSSECRHLGLPLIPVVKDEKMKCPWHGCVFYFSNEAPSVTPRMRLKIIKTLQVANGKISI